MAVVSQAAVTVAALVVAALGVRLYLLAGRVRAVAEEVRKALNPELTAAVREWREAALGVKQAVGKVDRGASSLAEVLARLERVSGRLEQDSLVRVLMSPAVAKATAWLAGVRRGLAKVQQQRGPSGPGAHPAPDEAELEG